MGRPREHDERTAAALLAAAERIVEAEGPEALSIRRVAEAVGTTTRAVYSVYGSKDGLLSALAAHAFELLHQGLGAVPESPDPAGDLVAAGLMFRRLALERPSLFSLGVQSRLPPGASTDPVRHAAGPALDALRARIRRLGGADRVVD